MSDSALPTIYGLAFWIPRDRDVAEVFVGLAIKQL